MFQMDDEEFTNWKSQIVTSNSIKMLSRSMTKSICAPFLFCAFFVKKQKNT